MSYILDALRRADAERQQGQIPGLNATSAGLAPAAPSARRLLPWAGLAALVLVLAALAAWWSRAPAVSVPTPPTSTATATVPAPAPAPVPAVPQPAAPSLPIVVSAAPVAPPETAAPAAAPTMIAADPAVPAGKSTAPPRPAAVEAANPVVAPSSPRPVPLAQLAPQLRRELPRLALGGSVWSPSAASRFVILDGQMWREGDEVAPGLVLENIQPKSAVLRWRELRLELAL